MENQPFEYWTTSGSAFSERRWVLTDINTKTLRKVGQQQQALAHTFMEAWNRQIAARHRREGISGFVVCPDQTRDRAVEQVFRDSPRQRPVRSERGKVELTTWVEKNVQPANQPVSEGSQC